jgi:hypothetical protein
MKVPLPVRTYQTETASTARLVNCFAEISPGKEANILRTAPGIDAWETVGTGPGRGMIWHLGNLYVVSGTSLYRVTPSGTVTTIGTIPGSDRVFMASNGIDCVIVGGGVGYVANTTVTAISDADFLARTPGAVDFLDGLLVFVEAGTGRFFASDSLAAGDYDALQFSVADAAPDKLITLKVDHRQVILFGEYTTELWYNSGIAGFPLERLPGGVVELGCLARHGVARQDNSVFWIANDKTIRRLDGQTPVRVSQHGMEKALKGYSTLTDCEAFPYSLEGHLCVVFRFPTAGATWVYDVTTQEWHERESWPGGSWDVRDIVEINGIIYVQHSETGEVGKLNPDSAQEWGTFLRPEWTYQPVYNEGRRLFHAQFEMGMTPAVTDSTAAPYITLEYSDDGGKTFVTCPTRSLGAVGQYKTRMVWHRLGSGRDRVYRASVSDPVPMTVWGSYAEIS